MTAYGADPEELDRVAAMFRQTAEELDRDGGLLTSLLNNVGWLGDNALRYLSNWSGVQMPKLRISTSFLREAATTLSRNAEQQRAASAAGSPTGPHSLPSFAPSSSATPAQQIEANFQANERSMRAYLQTIGAQDPLRDEIERRLDQGYRIYYFDPAAGYLAWSTGNLATASKVIVTVPGTGETMQSVTKQLSSVGGNYLNSSLDTAVISTLTWTPPPAVADNLALNSYEKSLVTGPLGDILTSLDASGRQVVVTGHSAGAAALQNLFEKRRELVATVDGVVLLAPSEFHAEFPGVMGNVPVIYAVHRDDPINLTHVDERGAITSVAKADNVAVLHKFSGSTNPLHAHDQSRYATNFADHITALFRNEDLGGGMVRVQIVEQDGSVGSVDVSTY